MRYDLTPRQVRINTLRQKICDLQQELTRLETADVDPTVAARPKPKRPKCGTEQGYQWHRRHEGEKCEPCRIAHSAHNRATKALQRKSA